MQTILSLIKTALPILQAAAFALEMLDVDREGTDDKLADGLRRIVTELTDFLADNASNDNVVKGLNAITAYGVNLILALDEIINSPAPKAERLAKAEALIDTLSDPKKVYQAQRGDDAKALNTFKIRCAEKLAVIRSQPDDAAPDGTDD